MSLLLGFPALRPSAGDVETWTERPVLLPEGWDAIEIDRLWVRGRPMRLMARNGERTNLEPAREQDRGLSRKR